MPHLDTESAVAQVWATEEVPHAVAPPTAHAHRGGTDLDRLLGMLAPCAALYDTLHTAELGRLLHLGSTETRLLTLLAHAGPMGVPRLLQLASANLAGTDAALERLSAAGLVARRRGQDDGQAVRAYTQSGRASAVLRTPSSALLRLTRMLGSLKARELAQVCQVLSQLDDVLTDALQAEPAR